MHWQLTECAKLVLWVDNILVFTFTAVFLRYIWN